MGAADQRPGANSGATVPPGTRLAGKYRVERTLGEGGMGVVVAAMHEVLGQRVAVKFLRPHLCVDEGIVGRFVREARMASRVQSEHVARVIDVGNLESGSPYMVMEYLEGKDLGEVLRDEGPMPMSLALDYVLQACEAIAEAHKIGIVHRDLKPSNFFLTKRADGSPLIKVLDFGISKLTESTSAPMDVAALTNTQNILGSPLYMSPEHLRNAKNVDARADIWALGVILYELMAGIPPFMGESVSHLLTVIATEQQEPLIKVAPTVPKPVSDIVEKCLTKKRDERYGSVAELARDLLPYAPRHARLSVERISRLAGAEPPPESLAETRVQLDSGGHPVLVTREPSQPPEAPAHAVSRPSSDSRLPNVAGVTSQSSTAEPVSSARQSESRSQSLDKKSLLPVIAGSALAGLAIFFGYRAVTHSSSDARPIAPAAAESVTAAAESVTAAATADSPKPLPSLAPIASTPAAPAPVVDAGLTLTTTAQQTSVTTSQIAVMPAPTHHPAAGTAPAASASAKPVASAHPTAKPAAFDPLGGRN
jgi:serine/threonine-protein kinase